MILFKVPLKNAICNSRAQKSTKPLFFADFDPILKSRRSDQGWFGSQEAIEKLKKDTRGCFNDTLFRNLDGIESAFEEDKRGVFFATINRRLKRIATMYT